MTERNVITLSGTHEVGSFGWRHLLTWRQLSQLWQIPVRHCLTDHSLDISSAAACSVALAKGENPEDLIAGFSFDHLPTVVFLNEVSLHSAGKGDRFHAGFQSHYIASNRFQHDFRIASDHPFTQGLPVRVSVYGDAPVVTPLIIEDGMEVLASLDGVPVITSRRNHLFVGADPWQLGVPSVPVLYKILSNWLIDQVRLPVRLLEPYAAIRLDDLPTTAEELKSLATWRKMDARRARTVARLRRFARHASTKFTIMYSSHWRDHDDGLKTISSIMPCSIEQMQLGVKEGVFEIGSHGMVHLRNISSSDASLDPREFLDLNERETEDHLQTAEREIFALFGAAPRSFVAPAWGYRPGVTKKIASKRYSAVVDSSQHVESGDCDVLSTAPEPDGDHFSMIETFRSGSRMLTYSTPEFWTCYAAAGVPIHYMQHTDSNWHVLRNLLTANRLFNRPTSNGQRGSMLVRLAEDPKKARTIRALCTTLLIIGNFGLKPSSWKFIWKALTDSSIYNFVRAMKLAGYKFVTLTELQTKFRNPPPRAHQVEAEAAARL